VAGHGLGIGQQVHEVPLPQLDEAVGLGAAVGRGDQPGQLVGVGLQRHAGHLTKVWCCRHQAAHLPHREQGMQSQELLEAGPHLVGRGWGGRQRHGRMIAFPR